MAWPPEFPDEEDWSVEEQLIDKLLNQLRIIYPAMSEDDLLVAGLEELLSQNHR